MKGIKSEYDQEHTSRANGISHQSQCDSLSIDRGIVLIANLDASKLRCCEQ